MNDKQVDLLKKFFYGIIIFSLLLFLSQAFLLIPKWNADKYEKKRISLAEQYDEKYVEQSEMQREVSELEASLAQLNEQDESDEQQHLAHMHWTDLKYIKNNQETIDLLQQEVEQLRKEKDLISVLTLEEKVTFIHQHFNNIKGDEPPTFGKNELFSVELKDENQSQVILNNRPPVYRTNLLITGPWAVILHESEAGISRYFDIVYIDPRLPARSAEHIDFGKAFELMKGETEDAENDE